MPLWARHGHEGMPLWARHGHQGMPLWARHGQPRHAIVGKAWATLGTRRGHRGHQGMPSLARHGHRKACHGYQEAPLGFGRAPTMATGSQGGMKPSLKISSENDSVWGSVGGTSDSVQAGVGPAGTWRIGTRQWQRGPGLV